MKSAMILMLVAASALGSLALNHEAAVRHARLYETSQGRPASSPAGTLVLLAHPDGETGHRPTAFLHEGVRYPISGISREPDGTRVYRLKTRDYLHSMTVRETTGPNGEARWKLIDVYDFLVRHYEGTPETGAPSDPPE